MPQTAEAQTSRGRFCERSTDRDVPAHDPERATAPREWMGDSWGPGTLDMCLPRNADLKHHFEEILGRPSAREGRGPSGPICEPPYNAAGCHERAPLRVAAPASEGKRAGAGLQMRR